MSPSRAKSIETELAQLLSMNEICNDDNDNDEDRGLDSKSITQTIRALNQTSRNRPTHDQEVDGRPAIKRVKSIRHQLRRASIIMIVPIHLQRRRRTILKATAIAATTTTTTEFH